MKILNTIITTALLCTGAHTLNAASISYHLNQSNAMPNGVDYVTVTISDNGSDIDFSVVVNTSNFPSVGNNFGMDNFYFNYDNSLTVDASNISSINPSSWNVLNDKNAGGGFGFFEFDLKGNGNSRTELLTFSISGVTGDDIYSYALGYQGTGDAYFAAHVAGFDAGDGTTSAKFASVVPVPAAAWLFGSGILGLLAIARRRA